MTGSAESDGIVEVTVQGDKRTVPAGSPNELQFGIELDAALCNEIHGSFETDLEAQFEEIGWNPTMDGTVVMVQDTAIIQAGIEEWTEGFKSQPDLTGSSAFPPGTPDIVKVFDSVVRRYNSWADLVLQDWNLAAGTDMWALTKDLILDIEDLHVRLRNLSQCEIALLGDARNKFMTLLTSGLLSTIAVVGEVKPDLTGVQLSALTQIALSVGGFGSGSMAPPAAVARAEAALQEAAVRILEPFVNPNDPDCAGGCISVTPDVKQVLLVAAQLRWTLEVEGKTIRAAELLSEAIKREPVPLEGN